MKYVVYRVILNLEVRVLHAGLPAIRVGLTVIHRLIRAIIPVELRVREIRAMIHVKDTHIVTRVRPAF